MYSTALLARAAPRMAARAPMGARFNTGGPGASHAKGPTPGSPPGPSVGGKVGTTQMLAASVAVLAIASYAFLSRDRSVKKSALGIPDEGTGKVQATRDLAK